MKFPQNVKYLKKKKQIIPENYEKFIYDKRLCDVDGKIYLHKFLFVFNFFFIIFLLKKVDCEIWWSFENQQTHKFETFYCADLVSLKSDKISQTMWKIFYNQQNILISK